MSTLDYYNKNAMVFISDTKEVKFSSVQQEFTSFLKDGASILDFGCGAGRDAKAFIAMGYDVTAVDGSTELCKLTSEYIGMPVKQMLFTELDDKEKYDAVWACASILHAKLEELPLILRKICDSMKDGGIFYASFKYGKFKGDRNGRYYTDVDEERWEELISNIPELLTEKIWISEDVRPGRSEEKWFNVIAVKRGK